MDVDEQNREEEPPQYSSEPIPYEEEDQEYEPPEDDYYPPEPVPRKGDLKGVDDEIPFE